MDFLLNTGDDSSVGQLKMPYSHPKRYILSQTIPVYHKDSEMNYFEQRLRRKGTEKEYFTNILRQQKKNMFVNTFLRKLKSTVIPRKAPQFSLESEGQNGQQKDSLEFELPRWIQIVLMMMWLVGGLGLLLMNSMGLIFEEIKGSKVFGDFMLVSLLLHGMEMGSKFIVHLNYQQNKLTKISQITHKYLQGQFWVDVMVLFGLVMVLVLAKDSNASFLFRLIVFGKIHSVVYIVEHLQITLIQNEYREQIWSLIKVFLFNFIFAHILTLALVLMARINPDNNWLVSRELDTAVWSEKYIWGYYWATTIMLTVGFGDITPRNSSEALCMVFIQTMSCIVLAYNINRVGTIIQKIRSYEATKTAHLKTFNQIKEKSQFISNQTKTRIMQYIKQSTEIKRNFNLSEEKQFIDSLPQSFKSDVLKEMNRHIWNGMMFFQNLSDQTLIKLSITIEKKLAHPQEILYTRGNQIEILVFNGGSFGYSFNNGHSANNGRIMQKFVVPSNKYQIATLDFLFKNQLKHDIKCTDYSVVYKVSMEQLIRILKHHSYDSEYFFMIKDKDKFLPNEYELVECELCRKQRHSVFKCPKLHYLPLKEHIVRKYKDKYYPKIFGYDAERNSMKKHQTLINFKANKKTIQSTRQFVNNYLNMQSQRYLLGDDTDFNQSFKSLIVSNYPDNDEHTSETRRQNQSIAARNHKPTVFYEHAIDQIRSKIDNIMNPARFSWDLELDLALNYKFYFRKYNSDEISNLPIKRKKKTTKIYTRSNKSSGYRKKNIF